MNSSGRDRLTELAIELQSLAQAGLRYTKDRYDIERFTRIREISAEIMSGKTDLPLDTVKDLFCSGSGYPTPKIDTRAAVIRDGRILLVQENDGRWSLPGGWCEITMSPAENTVKEVLEEAGRTVSVKSLIAVQNRDYHNPPPYAFGVVKIFYLCEDLGGDFEKNSETTDARFFSIDELPEMAFEKCTSEQVLMCYEAYLNPDRKVIFD